MFFEMIPLSLEEIFISETEVAGYDIKRLVFKYMKKYEEASLERVALTALFVLLSVPVLTALETSIMLRPDNLSKDRASAALAEAKLKLTNEMLHMYSIQCNAGIISIVTAVVLAASVSYLHSKKKIFSQPSDQPQSRFIP